MDSLNRVVILALVMAAVTSIATFVTILILYNVAFEENRARLVDAVHARHQMIEAVGRFDKKYSSDFPGGSLAATLAQVREAEGAFKGFGETGEFTFGHLENGEIHFIMGHRHDTPGHVHMEDEGDEDEYIDGVSELHIGEWLRIPADGQNGEPMRRAVMGQSGTVIDHDYRGVQVLAAYSYINVLKSGIVAKIDLAEIRKPFIKAAFYVSAIVVILIALGTTIFFRLGEPMVRQLRQSEGRQRQIIDLAPVPMAIIDRDERIIQVNAKLTETFGWDIEDIATLDKWWHTAMPNAVDRKKARKIWERAAGDAIKNGGEMKPQQWRVTIKNGEFRDIEFRMSQLNGISVLTLFDLTDRIRAKRELSLHREKLEELVAERTAEVKEKSLLIQASEDRFQASLSFAKIGTWDWNILTGGLFWSVQTAPLFGHKEGYLIATYENFMAAIHPDDREMVQAAITACVEGRADYDIEHRVIWPDETIRWVHERGGVTHDASGNPQHMQGVVQDISGQKQILMEHQYSQAMLEDQAKNLAEIADELENSRAEAEEASRAKSAFLAVMSHEIRTPLNGVIGMVDMMKETMLTPNQRHMVTTIRDSSLSLLTIINDILDFSKIEAGKMELDITRISTLKVIDGAASTLGPAAQNKSLEFFVFEDPAIPDFIYEDGDRLRQILLNLIGNAVKFTDTSDEKIGRIILRAEVENGDSPNGQPMIVFRVMDNGIGISSEVQQKLFRSFTQADGTITRRFGGTGLGLSICHSLVKMMNGDVSVESELGKGSIFKVRLPMDVATVPSKLVEQSDISGLHVALFSTNEGHGAFLKNYLLAASADVKLLSDMGELVPLIKKMHEEGTPIQVVVIDDAWKPGSDIDAIWPIIDEISNSETKALLTRYDGQSLPERFEGKCIALRDLPLGRMGFVRGVAIAAGRESPSVLMPAEHAFAETLSIPTVDEAEAMGELVLLAEDNLVNQDVIIRQLNMLGYGVIAAENGQVALERFKRRKFGLVLSDLHMPVMDGYQFAKEVRKIDKSKNGHTPLIAITAAALSADLDRCFDAGMDGYITKPMVLADMKKEMDIWLPHAAAPSTNSVQQANDHPIPYPDEASKETADAPVDPTMLVQMVGDDPVLHAELITEFLKATEEILSALNGHFVERRFDEYGDLTHRVKSSARAVGANKLGDLCSQLEVASRSDDWPSVEDLHPQLQPEFKRVKKFFIDTKMVTL